MLLLALLALVVWYCYPTSERLFDAIEEARPNLVRVYLTLSPGLSQVPNAEGENPLSRASYRGEVKTVDLLLAAGADPNDGGPGPQATTWAPKSPLLTAILRHNSEVVSVLLERGADPNRKQGNQPYPLFYAVQEGDMGSIQALLTHKANVNFRSPAHSGAPSPLIYAINRGKIDVARALIDAGADVNLANDNGLTALYAGEPGYVEPHPVLGDLLISRGAKVQHMGHPLFLLAEKGSLSELKALLEADPKLRDLEGWRGRQPIHFAALGDQVGVIRFLMESGAPVDARNLRERTPLHEAALTGAAEAAKFLLSRGADPAAKDRAGQDVLSLAQEGLAHQSQERKHESRAFIELVESALTK